MRGATRTVALALVSALILAPSSDVLGAMPDPVAPFLCRTPCGITLVGLDSRGTPDPAGAFNVLVLNIGGYPVQGSYVTLEFGSCADVSVCSAQVVPGPGVHCSAGARTISGYTDASGQITFTLVGGGTGHQPCSAAPCLRVYADGFLISDGINNPVVTVSSTDEDGAGGVGAADLSRLISDALSGGYCARSDFDHAVACVSSVGAPDISRWLTSFFRGYVYGCGSLSGQLCP
jgi:hypothetical protein